MSKPFKNGEVTPMAAAFLARHNLQSDDLEIRVSCAQLEDWPIWAKALKQFATPQDKGIGDVVARMIGDETSAKFKAWHLATFGKPCGCTGRQKLWNTKYPLT